VVGLMMLGYAMICEKAGSISNYSKNLKTVYYPLRSGLYIVTYECRKGRWRKMKERNGLHYRAKPLMMFAKKPEVRAVNLYRIGWSIPYGLRDAVNNVGLLKLLWYCLTDRDCRGYVVVCCEVLGYQEP